MAQPYVGEIRMFAGNFAPGGLDVLRGQLLPISENETLFQLIGTTYGGDGERRSRCPTCAAGSRSTRATASSCAETGGAEAITLTMQQIPATPIRCWHDADPATPNAPADNVLRASTGGRLPLRHRPAARPRCSRCRSHPSAEASRTRTSSRTSASTSSSRCSGSSRPRPEEHRMADPFVAEIRIFPFNFAPRAGRSATGSSCRSRRTRRCSRSSGPPTAATASPPSRCPTCRAARRCTRARAGPLAARPRRDGGRRR